MGGHCGQKRLIVLFQQVRGRGKRQHRPLRLFQKTPQCPVPGPEAAKAGNEQHGAQNQAEEARIAHGFHRQII